MICTTAQSRLLLVSLEKSRKRPVVIIHPTGVWKPTGTLWTWKHKSPKKPGIPRHPYPQQGLGSPALGVSSTECSPLPRESVEIRPARQAQHFQAWSAALSSRACRQCFGAKTARTFLRSPSTCLSGRVRAVGTWQMSPGSWKHNTLRNKPSLWSTSCGCAPGRRHLSLEGIGLKNPIEGTWPPMYRLSHRVKSPSQAKVPPGRCQGWQFSRMQNLARRTFLLLT